MHAKPQTSMAVARFSAAPAARRRDRERRVARARAKLPRGPRCGLRRASDCASSEALPEARGSDLAAET